MADELVQALLGLAANKNVCLLDSCGVGHLGSHLLIAGVDPVEAVEISFEDPQKTLEVLELKLSDKNLASIFTISYDFGLKLENITRWKLENITRWKKEFPAFPEPDIFLAMFDCLIIHDYNTHETFLTGNEESFDEIRERLESKSNTLDNYRAAASQINSNFTKAEYLDAIEKIKEYIRKGDTYQTNLTQQLHCKLPEGLTPEQIFWQLRKEHPAPFAAFIKRNDSTVVSASPERFIQVQSQIGNRKSQTIRTSPIKGTRPRGMTSAEDEKLRNELLESEKDRAENTMIVDLLRNDIGRICKFGSVKVEKLCDLEEHPTLFHLVSTISGELCDETTFSDILKAVFPCGSITGAPKIRTMQIINEIETADRGLSMGAIGYHIPNSKFQIPDSVFDLNVAIRTILVKNGEAFFNVGGGIVIDSIPEKEYEESLLKAQALINAIGSRYS